MESFEHCIRFVFISFISLDRNSAGNFTEVIIPCTKNVFFFHS